MKVAYFGISKSNRPLFDAEIEQLRTVLAQSNIQLNVFVDNYEFQPDQEKEMMETAFLDIDNSDWVIVELSKKAIGVGIEVGYAFAKAKPIIYLKKIGTEYSTTAAGCSDIFIEYKNSNDLKQKLEAIDFIK